MIHALSRLGFDLAITPNYSMAYNDNRLQHMANRKRILICAEEWFNAGVSAVPCVQAVNDRDFRFWLDFLREHEEVSMVCQEFLTGLASQDEGIQFIERVGAFQEVLGRDLHFIAIGGFKFRAQIRKYFSSWTLVDANPLYKALFRQVAIRTKHGVKWMRHPLAKGSPIDYLLLENIRRMQEAVYSSPRQTRDPHRIRINNTKKIQGQLTLDDQFFTKEVARQRHNSRSHEPNGSTPVKPEPLAVARPGCQGARCDTPWMASLKRVPLSRAQVNDSKHEDDAIGLEKG